MIVLDFDGTLVDVWRRYHIVFSDGLEDPSSAPTLDEFKALRRQLVRDGSIAQSIGTRLASDYFRTKKRKLAHRRVFKHHLEQPTRFRHTLCNTLS